MDTLFKILFGILLGVVGCLGWEFHESRQAAQKGLVPGWVPVGNSVPGQAEPSIPSKDKVPALSPDGAGETPFGRPLSGGPAPGAVTKETGKNVAIDLSSVKKDDGRSVSNAASLNIPVLSTQSYRWPRAVTLTSPFEIPIINAGVIAGGIPLKVGETLDVLRVQSDGQVQVRARGQIFLVSAADTDLVQRALPEGTPPPVRPRPVVPTTPGATKTPSSSPGATASKNGKTPPRYTIDLSPIKESRKSAADTDETTSSENNSSRTPSGREKHTPFGSRLE